MARAVVTATLLVLAAAGRHDQHAKSQQHGEAPAAAANASQSTPGNYGQYMNKFLPPDRNSATQSATGSNFGWQKYMGNTSGFSGNKGQMASYMGQYGGSSANYSQYVSLYSSMGGSNPASGSNWQGKGNDQLGAWNKAMDTTYGKYMPGAYSHFAKQATDLRAQSGGNGASAHSSTAQGPSGGGGGYDQYMKSYTGGGGSSKSSSGSSSAGGYQQYMADYASKYMGGGGSGGSGGGYQNYMKQYAGGYYSMPGSSPAGQSAAAQPPASSSATKLSAEALTLLSVDDVAEEDALRRWRDSAEAKVKANAPKEFREAALHRLDADFRARLAKLQQKAGTGSTDLAATQGNRLPGFRHASGGVRNVAVICSLAVAVMAVPGLISFAGSALRRRSQQEAGLYHLLLV